MAMNLSLNSISPSILEVKANGGARADIVGAGQLLFYDHARRGRNAMMGGLKLSSAEGLCELSNLEYRKLNAKFQADHLLYAAKKCSELADTTAPETFTF